MIGGTSVKAFPVPPLPSLAEMAEGSLVKMNESGAPVEFYVAKHDYESELNGAGRTLVVRKDVYDMRQWNTIQANSWTDCSMRNWLNGDYKALLDADIQEVIGTTTYYCTPGYTDFNVTTRDDAVFLLSVTELGRSNPDANVEGSALPIADTLKIAYLNGSTAYQWTRSPEVKPPSDVFNLNGSGNAGSENAISSRGSRPCFTLPSTVLVDEAMNIVA